MIIKLKSSIKLYCYFDFAVFELVSINKINYTLKVL